VQIIFIINYYMDKKIYLYLTLIIVLYVLYRMNANFENFENPDNIKIYIKSKYSTENTSSKPDKLESKSQTEIKNEEPFKPIKKDIIRQIHDSVIINTRNAIKNSYEQIFGPEKKKITSNNKTYIEKFMEYFNNKAQTCGFTYTIPVSTGSQSNLISGQMVYSNNQLELAYADINSYIGINLVLNNTSVIIQNLTTNSTYLMGINNLSTDNNGNYVVTLNAPGLPDDFFTSGNNYIISPCSPDNNFINLIIDHQIYYIGILFIIFILFIIIIINYKYITSFVYKLIVKEKDIPGSHEGGKQLFYVGGYDYRDYSD